MHACARTHVSMHLGVHTCVQTGACRGSKHCLATTGPTPGSSHSIKLSIQISAVMLTSHEPGKMSPNS